MPFPSPVHESEVAQSCPTLSDPVDCSLPGSSIHGIFQARVLEWVAIAFSDSIVYILCIFLSLGDGFDHCLLYSVMNLRPQFFRHSVYQI